MKSITAALVIAFCFIHNVYAGEEDLYDFNWLDPDKTVYVLQNKIHPKKNSLYFDAGYINNITSNFQDTNGASLKTGYFFTEEWALELQHINYNNTNNSAYDSIKVVNGTVPFIRRPISSTSLFIIWSPFYGKINTFNKIFYFDWAFGLGTGKFKMESNLDSVLNPEKSDSFNQKDYNPIQLKTNIKFHLNKRLHIGMEFLNTNFQAGSPERANEKSWKMNNDVIFTMGVSF